MKNLNEFESNERVTHLVTVILDSVPINFDITDDEEEVLHDSLGRLDSLLDQSEHTLVRLIQELKNDGISDSKIESTITKIRKQFL